MADLSRRHFLLLSLLPPFLLPPSLPRKKSATSSLMAQGVFTEKIYDILRSLGDNNSQDGINRDDGISESWLLLLTQYLSFIFMRHSL